MSRTITARSCDGIPDEPRSEVESIRRRKQNRPSTAGITGFIAQRITGAGVRSDFQAADRLLEVPRNTEINMTVDIALLKVRQNAAVNSPGAIISRRRDRRIDADARRKHVVNIGVVMNGQNQLLQIILALGPSGCLASLLDGWKQQRYQYGNDRDDDQQFDQCKC